MLKYDESANKKWESLLLLYWEYIIKNEFQEKKIVKKR